MLEINIPGYKTVLTKHLVLDFNGTLACDGKLIDGVAGRLEKLSSDIKIYVLTADTFGSAAKEIEHLPCELSIIGRNNQDQEKFDFIQKLGLQNVVAIGNGRNDQLMLQHAEIGILLIQTEGAAVSTLTSADVICTSINDALDLLLHPKRLAATLRI